jgi:hypothetical protein
MGIYACFPTYRWNGGRSIKLEGSDHAPVFTRLLEIPDISEHSTPSLSARYIPMIHGIQQTLGTRNFLILWVTVSFYSHIRSFYTIIKLRTSLGRKDLRSK